MNQRPAQRGQRGMVLILVLVALTVLVMGVSQMGMAMRDRSQREAELDLLSVGEQFQNAIESYWRASPGSVHQWPSKLEDLVEDHRFPVPRHHLRKLFADPMDPTQEWGVVSQGGGIQGVYSRAEGVPFRQQDFDDDHAEFKDAKSYADWRFLAASARPVRSSPMNSLMPGFDTSKSNQQPLPRPQPGRVPRTKP